MSSRCPSVSVRACVCARLGTGISRPTCGRLLVSSYTTVSTKGGSVAEWLACWTQAQKGPGSNRSRDAVG